MSAPNLVNVTSLLGKTITLALTTSAATILNNAASSNKLLKVVSLYVSNVDGANNADATIGYYSQDDIGGTQTKIAHTITVPADSTIVLVDKNAPIYLEEDRSIGGLASANSDLEVICSFEEYDDA